MSEKEEKARFPWGRFLRNLAVIAVPIACQNLLTTTASMVDTMMVAPLGELSVGALGLCAQFSSLMFSGYWGFVGGGMLFISQYWGSGEDEGIERSYGMTWVCMMTVALVFGCLAVFAPELVMKIYTDKRAIQEIGASYLRIVGFAYSRDRLHGFRGRQSGAELGVYLRPPGRAGHGDPGGGPGHHLRGGGECADDLSAGLAERVSLSVPDPGAFSLELGESEELFCKVLSHFVQ